MISFKKLFLKLNPKKLSFLVNYRPGHNGSEYENLPMIWHFDYPSTDTINTTGGCLDLLRNMFRLSIHHNISGFRDFIKKTKTIYIIPIKYKKLYNVDVLKKQLQDIDTEINVELLNKPGFVNLINKTFRIKTKLVGPLPVYKITFNKPIYDIGFTQIHSIFHVLRGCKRTGDLYSKLDTKYYLNKI